ncbi:uncharacterized protein LOC126667550 [Mercurialis annua]|uniref:uncharacterized protein LOC126667550 n=1 Tax=Mercurialis annua TaxID=3986 RepID=UPI0021604D6B|nr:uncharacterized protein LOC126667550 [Mercurialis annua]
MDKIQTVKQCLKASQDRQKSYTDRHRREIEYEVGEKVCLKVSPRKGVLRFGKQGKLSPKYIGPYRSDPSHVIQETGVELTGKLVYIEEPIEILGVEVFWFNSFSGRISVHVVGAISCPNSPYHVVALSANTTR